MQCLGNLNFIYSKYLIGTVPLMGGQQIFFICLQQKNFVVNFFDFTVQKDLKNFMKMRI